MSFVSHLEAAIDGTRLPAGVPHTTHEGRPIWVRYDLPAVARAVDRRTIAARPPTLWRYRELLPVDDDAHIVSLGETMTPLLPCPRLGRHLGLKHLWIKDESHLPTGSFKARGMAMAISMASRFGVRRVAIPTAGNAGGAAAAYAARAGMDCFVFMPEDTPVVNRLEATLFGARAFLVDGLINDCGAIVAEGRDRLGWFDLSTLKEPYRIEGKKTMGLELAEQMAWRLPDHIFYPTGGGTGLIGMWKAFGELDALGWLESDVRPRMHACQSDGCAPIPAAFARGDRFAGPVEGPSTVASGLRVPRALGDFMILDAVRASGGRAWAAEEGSLVSWMRLACRLEGIALCPEAAACLWAISAGVARGEVLPDQTVVVFNTGAAQKYIEVLESPVPRVDRGRVDWSQVTG